MRCKGLETRYALSKLSGISESHLGHYAKDARWPSNTHARLLAEAAGLPWAEVIADLEIERATDEATRTAWGKAKASLRNSAAALLLAMVCLVQAVPHTYEAGRAFFRRRFRP